jgi:hypothetical protein
MFALPPPAAASSAAASWTTTASDPLGAPANITASCLRFPALDIVMVRQSYERVAATRYRYRAVSSGFTAEIDVDDSGLPIDYAGIRRRIATGIGGDSCFFPWSSAPITAPPS